MKADNLLQGPENSNYINTNNKTSKCIKQKLIETKNSTLKSTTINGGFYISLSVIKETRF